MLDIIVGAEVVDIPAILPVSRDPKDDKFLATALAAAADYLVSEDADLLVLCEYGGIPIVDARTFLNIRSALE
ncbi:MAG TPA: putative toxin-antitoxin system toxin component, PIN family [Chloroflexota bacterium]|nr:putative toxin-antitoxin system toxin component, PIN family [Chloroflexota bacterium]